MAVEKWQHLCIDWYPTTLLGLPTRLKKKVKFKNKDSESAIVQPNLEEALFSLVNVPS